MNGKICMEGKLHPGNELAIARTVLANERTLMAILRTALGSFIGDASLLKFFGHPAYEIVKSHFDAWIPAFAGMTDFVSIRY